MSKKSNKEYSEEVEKILVKLSKKQITKEKLIKLGLKHFTEKTLDRILGCGNFVESVSTTDLSKGKVVRVMRCKNRFCPICLATTSRKRGYILGIVLQALKERLNYDFLFLTLTVPNVNGNQLLEELQKQYKAIKRFVQRKEFKKISKGYIRKTEITYNEKRDDYHPHIHLLIAVDSNYFTRENYVNQKVWLKIWRECKKNKSITQVHITKADSSSYRELAKYEAKDLEYLNYGEKVFDVFYNALHGRRCLTWNGCFQEYKKMYDNGELDSLGVVDENYYTKISSFNYRFNDKKYTHNGTRLMNQEELEKYNGMKIEDDNLESGDGSENPGDLL